MTNVDGEGWIFLSHPHVNNTFKVGMYTSKPGYKTNLNGRAMTNVDDEGRIFLSHPHVNNTFKVGMYTSKPGYKTNLNVAQRFGDILKLVH